MHVYIQISINLKSQLFSNILPIDQKYQHKSHHIYQHHILRLNEIYGKQSTTIYIAVWLTNLILLIIIYNTRMMKRLIQSTKYLFGKYKQPNPNAGFFGQQPDLKGAQLDKFRRFFTKVHHHHAGEEMPNFQAQRHDLPTLQRNQIETRILRLIRDLEIIELRQVKFDADIRKDLKIDSLNVVALLTSIEHEFTTVFQDNVFEGVKNLNEVVTLLMRDPKII